MARTFAYASAGILCLVLSVWVTLCAFPAWLSSGHASPPSDAGEGPDLSGKGDIVSWTADAPIDIDAEAVRHRVFIGPMSKADAGRIGERNPKAVLFQYLMARYVHHYFQSEWEAHAGDEADAGYLHRPDGSIVLAPDAAKPWPVANILPGSPYREWLLDWAAKWAFWTDGVMIDNPMPFTDWANFQNPVECTEEEYKAACLSFITELKEATRKKVVVNLSTLWWYLHGPDNERLRQAVERADGVFFQAGGCWKLTPLKDKLVIMGGQTPLVFVGTDT